MGVPANDKSNNKGPLVKASPPPKQFLKDFDWRRTAERFGSKKTSVPIVVVQLDSLPRNTKPWDAIRTDVGAFLVCRTELVQVKSRIMEDKNLKSRSADLQKLHDMIPKYDELGQKAINALWSRTSQIPFLLTVRCLFDYQEKELPIEIPKDYMHLFVKKQETEEIEDGSDSKATISDNMDIGNATVQLVAGLERVMNLASIQQEKMDCGIIYLAAIANEIKNEYDERMRALMTRQFATTFERSFAWYAFGYHPKLRVKTFSELIDEYDAGEEYGGLNVKGRGYFDCAIEEFFGIKSDDPQIGPFCYELRDLIDQLKEDGNSIGHVKDDNDVPEDDLIQIVEAVASDRRQPKPVTLAFIEAAKKLNKKTVDDRMKRNNLLVHPKIPQGRR